MLAGIFLGLLLGLVYLGLGVFAIWFREPRVIPVGIFCIFVAIVCFFFFVERCFLGWHKLE